MPVVIIPAYKPDETLVTITGQLWEYGCRIIVVDDGSGEEYQMVFFPHIAAFVLAANILARMISAFYNYSMNCRFVFHTRRKLCTVFQYFELAAFVLFMNNVILEIFVQF